MANLEVFCEPETNIPCIVFNKLGKVVNQYDRKQQKLVSLEGAAEDWWILLFSSDSWLEQG